MADLFRVGCCAEAPHVADFAAKMLVVDPRGRASAAELLRHPFLAEVADVIEDLVPPSGYMPDIEWATESKVRQPTREDFDDIARRLHSSPLRLES